MIIELFGLPGSGKSMIAGELAGRLKKKGYSVLTYADFKQMNETKSAVVHSLREKTGRRYLINSILFCVKYGILIKGEVLKRILSCLSFISYYQKTASLCDFIIMDEGIIQGIVSAIYTYNKKTVFFDFIIRNMGIGSEIKFIYLYVDVKVACKRIEDRKTPGHGRCDDIDDFEERSIVLKHQKQNFNQCFRELKEYYAVDIICSDNKDVPMADAAELFVLSSGKNCVKGN